jgi:hypothetical protein
MSISILPTFEDPFYSYATILEGKSYFLRFRFNVREDCWYISIYLPDLTPLCTGIKIVDGVNLLQRSDDRLPPGQLFAASLAPQNLTPAGLEELGQDKRVVLAYATADEFDE